MARTIEVIQKKFHEESGHKIMVSLGSSGSLTHQILHGAPFAAILSADREYILQLLKAGLAKPPSMHYASGRICFYIPDHSAMANIDGISTLISKLSYGDFNKLAIANPRHAPYGRAARTALQRAGIWSLESRKLIMAENIAQTMQFTRQGAVDVGIVAYSHYLTGDFRNRGQCIPIPEYWHDPIEQHMILLKEEDTVAAAFIEFMQSDTARKILIRHGYIVP